MEAVAAESAVEIQESSVESSASSDQGDYMSDAFGDYFRDPKEEAPEPQKAEVPKQDAVKPQVEAPKEEQKTEQKSEEVAKDPFESAFTNENGELDIEKLIGLNFDGAEFRSEEKTQEEQAQQQAQQDQDARPAWQKELDEEKAFRESIHTSRLGPLNEVYELMQQGVEPIKALQDVFARVQVDNEAYLKQRDEENFAKKRQAELDKIKDEARATRLPEIARANAFAILNKLPGDAPEAKVELYNRVMFGADAGGELLDDMFSARYPDFVKESPEKQKEMKVRFVNELQADPARLQRHFQRAYRYLAADPKNLKRVMEQASNKASALAASNNLAAQRAPSGAVQRPAPNQTKSKWDSYMSDTPRARI